MRFLRFSLVLILAFAPSILHAENRVSILCYHAFLESKNPYCFSMAEVAGQMKRLKAEGFTFVSFDDVVNNRLHGTKNVLVTVDDGNHTMYRAWKEVFRPMGIRPVIGIYPAIINRKEYAMTWDQVRELSREGCTVAAHGWFHLFVHKKPRNEKEEKYLKQEISRSRKVLREKLGIPVDLFVYPFGGVSDFAVERVRADGYRWALALGEKNCSMPVGGDGLYRMPRYLMTRQGCDAIIARISGKSAPAASTAVASVAKQKNPVKKDVAKKVVAKKDVVKKEAPGRTMVSAVPVVSENKNRKENRKEARKEKKKELSEFLIFPSVYAATYSDKAGGNGRSKETAKTKENRTGTPDAAPEKLKEKQESAKPSTEAAPVRLSVESEPAIALHQPGFRLFCRNIIRDADMIYMSWIDYVKKKLPRKDVDREKPAANRS